MKGLNIKKIVALGLGAALVGSALAPAVMAAAYSNLTEKLTSKSQIIDSATGAPVVDVVVGTIGRPIDVVWAGNIAAKVAQMATVPTGSGAATVDLTVGGSTSISGNGDTVESAVSFANPETAFEGIQVTDSKMPSLVNETSATLTWAGADYTTTVKEVLKGTMDVGFQGDTSSSKYAVGELFGTVNAGDINYSVELGSPGIPLSANAYKNLDGNSDYDVSIPFLGKVYKLDAVTADSLILYADTTPTDLKVGEKITVTPGPDYNGKKMEIQLVDLIQVGSGNTTYQPKWALLIDGVASKYVQKGADVAYDLRTEFGKSYFTDSIFVTSAGLNLAANSYTATVRTGSDRLELKDGKGFPFVDDSTIDDKEPWKVVLTQSGGIVSKINLVNQWSYKKTSGSESDTSKYVLKVGEAVTMPNDFATFKFVGLQTKPTAEIQVGDISTIDGGGIKYADLRGDTVNVPFYKQFDIDFNKPTEVSIAGKDYTFWIDNGAASYDLNVAYISGKHGDALVHTTWDNIDVNNNAILATSTVPLDLGAENATGTTVNTNYLFVTDSNAGLAGLVLKGAQTFNLSNKANSTSIPKLVFNGTSNPVTGVNLAAYVPNTDDFLGTIMGSTLLAYNSSKYLAASLSYTDNSNYPASLYVRTGDTAKVWEYKAIKSSDNNLLGPSQDANAADWAIGADVTTPLTTALTTDGTIIDSDGSVFTLTVPDENRNAEVYLGGTDMTPTTVGGDIKTGLVVGGTAGNVTVKAINAPTAGVTVTKVSNLVKPDTAVSGGKSILVGGWLANTQVASTLPIDSNGTKLSDVLVSDGDYVAAVLDSGSIVVAGWSADGSDTASAAQALIAALDKL